MDSHQENHVQRRLQYSKKPYCTVITELAKPNNDRKYKLLNKPASVHPVEAQTVQDKQPTQNTSHSPEL